MRILAACHLLLLALGLTLASCSQTDPYVREGVWHPLGANAANLRAMIADPRDLDEGQPSGEQPGDIAAAAVARLRADRVKPLPASSISSVRATDTSAAYGGAGDASAAAPVAAAAGAAGAAAGQ